MLAGDYLKKINFSRIVRNIFSRKSLHGELSLKIPRMNTWGARFILGS